MSYRIIADECHGCRVCKANCAQEAIVEKDNVCYIDPEKCTECGRCYEVCPLHSIDEPNDNVDANS